MIPLLTVRCVVGPVLLALGACMEAMAATQDILERDWIRQLDLRFSAPSARKGTAVAPGEDARGGCDGVINGEWGFHTGLEENPWWQVDLEGTQSIAQIRIYNRCDTPERTVSLQVHLSLDGKVWESIYTHQGGHFLGFTDSAPLLVAASNRPARFVRLVQPGHSYFNLDEVQVCAAGSEANIALHKPALQSSVSQWSVFHRAATDKHLRDAIALSLERGDHLADDLAASGVDVGAYREAARSLREQNSGSTAQYIRVRAAVRDLALRNPLFDFDRLLVAKTIPGSFTHMSDQYLGWWSRPGGGIYVLSNLKSGAPHENCLTQSFAPGTFLRPMLSWDGKSVLFAYCRHYPDVSKLKDKVAKANLPEDSFFHLYEMKIDGTGLRQITHGKYNDFDGRYLPDGRIVFLSTRRGPWVQYTAAHAQATAGEADGPECYVRCGGDHGRPCAVYTLHAIDADGRNIVPLSAFEMFEWTPAVNADGSLLYARWDYIDRHNMPYMKLWRTNPDGTSPSHVFGNYTHSPHTAFEAVPIPGSQKIVFTAGAHHSISGGSLAILDPTRAKDGEAALTRITPELAFPETETRGPDLLPSYYASPWPLSEKYLLCAWSHRPLKFQPAPNAADGLGIYWYDTFGNLELIYRDEAINTSQPIPLRPRPRPPVIASHLPPDARAAGRFLLGNVYQSLRPLPANRSVTHLRVVAVPPKTQPEMNTPSIGITRDDPGKCVLGTVPVEADGSAYFEAPANVTLFFQALDAEGVAVQTMRSATYLQPGQTLSCVGCHENRQQAPPQPQTTLASRRAPSKISPGPEGSWPFRFDQLVFPTLGPACASCHDGKQEERLASESNAAWKQLIDAGKPSLRELVDRQYNAPYSTPGAGVADNSYLLKHLRELRGKEKLDRGTFDRFVTWMDLYAQRQGHFDARQETELVQLRQDWTAWGIVTPSP